MIEILSLRRNFVAVQLHFKLLRKNVESFRDECLEHIGLKLQADRTNRDAILNFLVSKFSQFFLSAPLMLCGIHLWIIYLSRYNSKPV